MQQLTFKQGLVYAIVLLFVGAVAWWFVTLHRSATERENILAHKIEQDKKVGEMLPNMQAENSDIKKHLETMIRAFAERKPGEPIPQIKLAPPGPTGEEKALSKARVRALEGEAQRIRTTLDKIEVEIQRWDTRIKSLMNGEDGKKLAGNKALAEQFASIREKKRMSTEGVENIRDKTGGLLTPFVNAARDGKELVLPGAGVLKEMDDLLRAAQDGLQVYEQDWRLLDTILADSASGPPGAKSLEVVLVEIRAEYNRKRSEAITQAKKLAFDGATEQIAIAEGRLEMQRGELEAKRVDEIAKTEKVRKEFEIGTLQATRKREELLAKYELSLPDIQIHLGPFISNGYAQPDGIFLKKQAKAEPMSYSRLAGVGVLTPGRPGLEKLLQLGGTNNNDRYRGNFPRSMGGEFGWNQADKVFLQKAQDLLKEFGPIMVEKGMLSK